MPAPGSSAEGLSPALFCELDDVPKDPALSPLFLGTRWHGAASWLPSREPTGSPVGPTAHSAHPTSDGPAFLVGHEGLSFLGT